MRERLLKYLDNQLDHMLARPEMFGPPLAVEMQFLQALDFRRVVAEDAPDEPVAERHHTIPRITGLWSEILHEAGLYSNIPVASQTEGYDTLRELLPKLREVACAGQP